MPDEQKQTDSASQLSANLSAFGDQLLLFAQSIIVFTKNDQFELFAAYIKLFAGFLFLAAVQLQAQNNAKNQPIPGQWTSIDIKKYAGTAISEIGGIILTDVLEKETLSKKAAIGANEPFFAI